MGVDIILSAIGISEEQVDEAMDRAEEEADPHVRFYNSRDMFYAFEIFFLMRPSPPVSAEIFAATWMPEFQTPMEDSAVPPVKLSRRIRACAKYWGGPDVSFERLSELLKPDDGPRSAPLLSGYSAENFEELRKGIVDQLEALARHCDYVGRAGATAVVLEVSV